MKILIEESVLREALEALEQCYVIPNSKMHPRNRDKAITALRSALDAADKMEPYLYERINLDKALLAKIASQQDPSDALERLKRVVDDVGYANEKDEQND